MKILLRVILIVSLVFSFSHGVIAATEDSADRTTVAQDEDAATEPAAEIPDSVDMNLGFDESSHRKVPGKVICRIEKRDGTPVDPVDKSGEAYQFRVPNYPREEYPEQPDYFFVSSSRDNEGNYTTVRMPLYVVNTQVAYEGGVDR